MDPKKILFRIFYPQEVSLKKFKCFVTKIVIFPVLSHYNFFDHKNYLRILIRIHISDENFSNKNTRSPCSCPDPSISLVLAVQHEQREDVPGTQGAHQKSFI